MDGGGKNQVPVGPPSCPNCGEETWRDSADVGVGVIFGPYGCSCGWSEWDEYNQLLGNGGRQANGGYTDPYGVHWPSRNPVTALMKESETFGDEDVTF